MSLDPFSLDNQQTPASPYTQQFIPQPPPGDAWDSRWGGPVSWDQRMRDYAAIGTSGGRRPFEGLGKIDLAETLPTAPVIPGSRLEGPSQAPPPQPGLAESLTRGLTGMVTQFIPNNDIQQGADNVASVIGGALDLPFNLIPTIGFLPGGGDLEETFWDVRGRNPDDEMGLQYEAYVANDTANAARYMSEYLNARGSELSEAMGISGVLAPMFTPSQTLGEQMRRIVFGGLTGLGDGVARTVAGSGLRDVQGSILNRPMEDLPEELQELRARYEAGQISYDQLLDELSIGRFRWTNDDSAFGAALSFGLDVLTDPFTWASLGIGGAAKAAATGSVRMGQVRIIQALQKAGRYDEGVNAIRSATGRKTGDLTADLAEWTKANAPQQYEEGIATLSSRQRALYNAEPIITPAAKIANTIDNPFAWIPAGRIGRALGNNLTTNHMRGFVTAHGTENVRRVQNLFGDKEVFNRYLGIAGENQNLSLHQQKLARDVLAADPEFRGDMMVGPEGQLISPSDVVDARQSVSRSPVQKKRDWNDAAIAESQEHVYRNMEVDLPSGDVGQAAVDAGYKRTRDQLAQPLADMTGMSLADAKAFLKNADRKTLAFVHQLNYGKTISDFLETKRIASHKLDIQIKNATEAGDDALVTDLTTKKQSLDESYTLISAKMLTRRRAKALLEEMEAEGADAGAVARRAVDQYDQLGQNYADARFSETRLAADMKRHLEQLLERGEDGSSKLIEVLTDDELMEVAPDLAKRLGKQEEGMYSVGLAPKDRWGATVSESGHITGINTFIDVMDDSGVPVTRAFGRRDRIRSALFENIRGSRIHYEARQRFIEDGVAKYGLTKGDAKNLFDEIRQQSMRMGIGARGFTAEQINDIAKNIGVRIDEGMYDAVGERGLLELSVRAWEGELSTVGLTTKVSGKVFKSPMVTRTNNLVGRISENLYPYLRFGLSPMFLAMELTEGPFFAILRGIKPGVRWTADDIRLNSILQDIQTHTKHTDQLEKAQLAFAEGKAINRIVTRTGRFTRYWNKLAPQRAQRKTIIGKAETSLYEYKRLLYIRQWGHDAALEMKENSMRYYPDGWTKWEAQLGTSDPVKVYMAIMEDRGIFDNSQRHGLHMMDAAKPSGTGRMERIRQGDVSNFMGYQTVKEMQADLKDSTLTRDQFIQRYRDVGLNEDFAARAYTVGRGMTEKEWVDGIAAKATELTHLDKTGQRVFAESYTNLNRNMARVQGMDFAEYMNTKHADLPDIVDVIPESVYGRAFFQSLRTHMERSGMTFPDSKALKEMEDMSKALVPPPPSTLTETIKVTKRGKEVDQEVGLPYMFRDKKTGEMKPGRMANYENARTLVRQGNNLVSKDPKVKADAIARSKPPGKSPLNGKMKADGVTPRRNELTKVLAEVENMAGGEANAVQWANWYQEMPQLWYGMLSKMPDSTIKMWSATMDDLLGPSAKRAADPRAELAVRMNIAFSVTQQNNSVNRGVQFVMQAVDELSQLQADRGYKYGTDDVTRRINALMKEWKAAPPDALRQKLYDFTDSMTGKATRTFTEGMEGALDLQPAAMDVWMKRYFGFPDSEWFDLKVQKHMKDKGVGKEAAEEAVLKNEGWTRADVAGSPEAPSEYQYERMLMYVNDLKDEMNRTNWGGKTDWKAADAQAALWVHTQKSVDYVDSGAPHQLLVQEGQQASLRLDDFGRRYPTMEQLREAYGDAADDVMASIAHDVVKSLVPLVTSETGTGVLRVIDTVQRVATDADVAEGAIGKGVPTATVALFGTKKQTDEAMALMGALLQQDRITSLTSTNATKAARTNGQTWALDFEFGEGLDQNLTRRHLADLNDFLDAMDGELGRREAFPESLSGLSDNDALMVSRPWVTKGTRDLARFEADMPIPEKYLKELNDGTWVKRFDGDADPLPITINRKVKGFTESNKDTHAQRMRDAGRDNADAVIRRRAKEVKDIVDAAYARRANKVFKSNIDVQSAADPGAPSVWAQRKTRSRGRPTTGRSGIRAAFDAGAADHGATTYFVRGADGLGADPTSAIHESFHLFTRDLDPTGHRLFIDAYGASNPKRRSIADAARADGRMTRDIEEWAAAEFEKWAAGDMAQNIHVRQTFKGYAEWAEKAGLDKGSPELEEAFGRIFEREQGYQGVTWHADEQRWWEATRLSNMRAEDQAHSTAYYRRGRGFIERSINHPYLGFYPASYMWGKVVPELTRFLISRPFGLQAPLLGLSMATHLWRNLQMQLQVDEDLRDWVDDHPDTVRIMQLMVPGTPWELPANAPVVMRRAMEIDAENKLRVLQGKEPKEFDPAGSISDMLSYSVGYTNLLRRMGGIADEFFGEEEEEAVAAPEFGESNPFVGPQPPTV